MTTTLAWHLGVDADPGIKEPLRQVATWIDLRTSLLSGGYVDRLKWISIQGAWFRLIQDKRLTQLGWRIATGPTAATILTLRSLGWEPTTPTHWCAQHPDLGGDTVFAVLASDGDAGPCSEKDKREIMDAIREDLLNQHWVKASKHYLGGGLEKGQPFQAWFLTERPNGRSNCLPYLNAIKLEIQCDMRMRNR